MDLKGNIIYAVDFDGTLSRGRWPELGEPNEIIFDFLIEKKKEGRPRYSGHLQKRRTVGSGR